jgi:hypothetical protein
MKIQEIIQSIDDLQGMLHELDREDRVFLSDEATNIITSNLVEFNSDDLEEILIHGCKGYANMTDLELIEEYKYTIREVDEDNASTIYKEVEEAIRQIVAEQAEKALLDVQ